MLFVHAIFYTCWNNGTVTLESFVEVAGLLSVGSMMSVGGL